MRDFLCSKLIFIPNNQSITTLKSLFSYNLVNSRKKIRYFVMHLVLYQFHKS